MATQYSLFGYNIVYLTKPLLPDKFFHFFLDNKVSIITTLHLPLCTPIILYFIKIYVYFSFQRLCQFMILHQ